MSTLIEQKIKELEDAIETGRESMQPLQLRLIENDLKNIKQALGARDTFVSLNSSIFLMWEYAIKSAQKEICAIATNRGGKSGHGFSLNTKMLDVQNAVIDRGVSIHRIFSLNKEEYQETKFMELLRAQINVGIDTWVAHDNVTLYVNSQEQMEQENYVIIDDIILYRSFLENGEMKNSVSFDKELVKKYRASFERLLSQSYQFSKQDLPKDFNEI